MLKKTLAGTLLAGISLTGAAIACITVPLSHQNVSVTHQKPSSPSSSSLSAAVESSQRAQPVQLVVEHGSGIEVPSPVSEVVKQVSVHAAAAKPQPKQKLPAKQASSSHSHSSTQVPHHENHGYNTTSRSSSTVKSSEGDLYWLSHIIHAEAVDQPFDAQIAVGDVILNRVRSGQYPNTIKGVIFQIAGGHYQFTPVLNGFIYTQPDAASIEAAKRVLAGVNLVPNALVYYTPSKTPATSWVRKQPFITSIGNFVFAK